MSRPRQSRRSAFRWTRFWPRVCRARPNLRTFSRPGIGCGTPHENRHLPTKLAARGRQRLDDGRHRRGGAGDHGGQLSDVGQQRIPAQPTFARLGVSRNLLVVVKKRPGFKYAFISRLPLVLSSSSGLVVDSFNSTKTTESTNGRYDVAKRTAHGNIASLDASASSISIKGVSVYGYASTAPSGHMNFQSGSS